MHMQAMSPNGKYIIGNPVYGDTDTFGLWHDGEYSEGKLSADTGTDFLDVSDSGDILGYSSYDWVVWRYIDGELQYLKAPDGLGGSYPRPSEPTAPSSSTRVRRTPRNR